MLELKQKKTISKESFIEMIIDCDIKFIIKSLALLWLIAICLCPDTVLAVGDQNIENIAKTGKSLVVDNLGMMVLGIAFLCISVVAVIKGNIGLIIASLSGVLIYALGSGWISNGLKIGAGI